MKEHCYHRGRFFQVKCIVRCVVEVQKSGTPCFIVSIPTNTIVLDMAI